MAYLALAAASSAEAIIGIAEGVPPSQVGTAPPSPSRVKSQHTRARVLNAAANMVNDGEKPPRDPVLAEYVTRIWLRSAVLFLRTPESLLREATKDDGLQALEQLLFIDKNSIGDPQLRHRLAHLFDQGAHPLKSRMAKALTGSMRLPRPRVILARIAAFVVATSEEASRREPSVGKPLTCRAMHGAFLAALRDEPSKTVDMALPANDDSWRKAVEREAESVQPLALAAIDYRGWTKLAQ